MATPMTITLPVSPGDTVYKKCTKILHCRYFGDKYANQDGQPNCREHFYDCLDEENDGKGCDATFEYFVKPATVDDTILYSFAREILTGKPDPYASEKYLLSEKDAHDWIAAQTNLHKKR